MPQYGVIIYTHEPADPMAMELEYLELLSQYPERAKESGGKVLGASYFAGHRGFAFEPTTKAVAIRGDEARDGTLLPSDLVVSAFFVVSAPSMEVAVRVAKLHPAVRDGGVEVRPLFTPLAE